MIKAVLEKVLPRFATRLVSDMLTKRSIATDAKKYAGKSAEEIFTEIYRSNAWGGKAGEFYSGSGSSGPAALTYVEAVNRFIKVNNLNSVLDLGCGDFAIGMQIVCGSYTGVDVVAELIDYNNKKFGTDKRRFIHMDITKTGDLPHADLCLVRQVFQHLSNEQIESVLRKLGKFKFVIVTEHQPSERDFISVNRDKASGPDTRLYHGSGVYLDRPPFNIKTEYLFEHPDVESAHGIHARGPIRSFLVKFGDRPSSTSAE